MNFDYSDEQKALKDEARRFLSAVSPLTVVRAALESPGQGYDKALWQRIGEQGWCGAAIPEHFGGIGMGYVELCALAEELGRALAPVPFASTVYQFAEALLLAGSAEQKSELLPRVASGSLIGTLAVSEGPGVLVPDRIATRFAGGVLSGAKLPVTDGMAADRAVVLALADGGPGLYLVDLSGEGVERRIVSTIDPTRGAAEITFAGAPAEPLGQPGEGIALLARIQDRAAILLAFEQLGGADRALEMARDYALERYAFGRPIGSYQAIKHKLADVFVRNEVARANAYYGAWALSTGAPELPLAAAAARVAGSAAYLLASRENIQTHGGIGFTWEADCHFFYRRARHLGLILGAPRDWKRRVADRLELRLAAENEREGRMNFDDSPEEAAYRAKVRAWIAANAPDLSRLSPEERRNWHPAHKDVAREWQAVKADAGYACISWPREQGGAGGSAIEEAIFNQEESRAGVQFTYFMTGLHMLLPALMEHNKDDASLARVPPAVRGEEIWCQLFSEPASGSDSAGVRCAAVRTGDDWVINGQKVWNSGAQIADYGMLVARTDPDVPKHKGLTVFWLDMKTPGVEVRPIRMMSGDNELNEVFLTDVRLPDSQRVGEIGGGWKVIISTLMNERAALGSGTGLSWRDVMALARQAQSWDGSALEDPAFREWLADLYVDAEAIRLLSFRTLTSLSRGTAPGPEGSAGKLLWSGLAQTLTDKALDILDHQGLLDDPAEALMNGAFQHRFLWAPGLRLGGGTDEIMKNIIAERVLGLPGDIRVDKNVPFREIPNGR